MIPKNIDYDAVVASIKRIDAEGVPANRKSRKYFLEFEGKQYPPKYTVARANQIINGEFLESDIFNGGKETNSFLERLGFTIVG
jgi:hypothetical protein